MQVLRSGIAQIGSYGLWGLSRSMGTEPCCNVGTSGTARCYRGGYGSNPDRRLNEISYASRDPCSINGLCLPETYAPAP